MSLRHALLGLLAERPASGYELTKQFELSLANVWSAKHSQIYPELQRMAEQGWVVAGDEGARGRRDYRITPSGRTELHRWLTGERPDRSNRNEAMLRVFFLWTLPDDEVAAYLRREAEGYRSALAALGRLDTTILWDDTGADRMGRIALEQGRRWSQMMADWADWAAEQVEAGHDATELSGQIGAPPPATIEGMNLADDLRQLFDGLATADAYPGVVLVEHGTDTVFEGAYGFASRAWRVPNTLDTRFDTASITKAFTATAVLQLIDDGRLSFDTSVIDLLGLEGTTISREVTVLHCLTHTSGIADDADEEAGEAYADVFRDRPNYSVVETVDFLPQFAYKPAVFPPGQGCRYNNVAFVLLGLCIEHVTGTSYRDHVREHVFARAGMARTDFFRMDVVAHDVAEGADPIVGDDGAITGWRRNIYSYPPIGSPDGGAHTTVHDLARFWRAARTGQLFSAELTERFLQPQAFHSRNERRVLRYGFGIDHESDLDDRPIFMEKEGFNAGVSADVRWYPGRDITVAMLSNTSDGVWAPLREVHELVLGM